MNFAAIPHAARNEAPAAHVVLPTLAPPVQAADVRSPTDRFRCVPYSCVLTAEACAKRQRLVGAATADREAGGRVNSERIALRTAGTPYRACADCAEGRRVAAAISN